MRKGDLAAIIDLNEKDDQIQPLTAARPIGTRHLLGVIVSLIFRCRHWIMQMSAVWRFFCPSRVVVSRIISAAAQPGIWIR